MTAKETDLSKRPASNPNVQIVAAILKNAKCRNQFVIKEYLDEPGYATLKSTFEEFHTIGHFLVVVFKSNDLTFVSPPIPEMPDGVDGKVDENFVGSTIFFRDHHLSLLEVYRYDSEPWVKEFSNFQFRPRD